MRLALAWQGGEYIVELGLGEGLGFECQALMHSIGRQQRLERTPLDRLGSGRTLGGARLGEEQCRFLDILAQAEEALHDAQRIGERRRDRVAAVDELRTFRRYRSRVTLLARSGVPLIVPLM